MHYYSLQERSLLWKTDFLRLALSSSGAIFGRKSTEFPHFSNQEVKGVDRCILDMVDHRKSCKKPVK
uniref:Putative ovule protein n=1 Tax=Solanum chacoense TaxID=4108 RepID=A0A0V0GWA5_SOLCH